MLKSIIIILVALFSITQVYAQSKGYTPKIEPCDCAFKADTSLKTKCAYLIVPESRKRSGGKTIKLPFIIVESNNPNKRKDPVLFTGGGPGSSSLSPVRSINRRSLIKNRDYIAFEQRGTRYAVPNLDVHEISEDLQMAFRHNLPKDSMILAGVKRARKNLIAQGIDLDAYNTDESAADIGDLLQVLRLDSVNLLGISYSGGLMMTVLKNNPTKIRSVILDSPLPEFVNIDEEEEGNFNEALNTIFRKCEADSLDKEKYGNLKERFQQYFTAIHGKTFSINYLEKGKTDSTKINYSTDELIGVLEDAIGNNSKIKDVPYIVTEMIKGHHQQYVKDFLDGIFNGGATPGGMRMSVYCSDKMAYAHKNLVEDQYSIYPYMKGAGFYLNNVDGPMCACWDVKPIALTIKLPFYSNVPALLGAGDTDPSCRQVYNDMIHHFLPNSQRLVFIDKDHAPLLNTREGDGFIGEFLDHPFKRIESDNKKIIAY